VNKKTTSHLQQMMKEQNTSTKVLAITSGKGGVGKTNIACNLAICLAASDKKVTLLDADLGLGNIDLVMNTENKFNLMHVISGQKTLDEIINIGPGGVETICGGSGIEELANISKFQLQRLLDDLEKLQQSSDIIIIDTGAGIHNSTISFCLSADEVLVVTTPEPASMTDAYAMIKVLKARNYDGRISLLVNMASSLTEGKRIFRQVSEVSMRFLNVPVYEAGIIRKTDKLTASVKKRVPVVINYPNSGITSAFASAAARLMRTSQKEKSNESFFRKVVNVIF